MAVILAAGEGKRMGSGLPKVLHRVAGRPMIARVVAAACAAGCGRLVVVVGATGGAVRDAAAEAADEAGWSGDLRFAAQRVARGTGDAVLAARDHVPSGSQVLVLCGDTPLVTGELLRHLLHGHAASAASATLLTAVLARPAGYGRIVRSPDGVVRAVVEDADCTAEQAAIAEVNTGIACYREGALFAALAQATADNAQGEIYLTSVVAWLCDAGRTVAAVPAADASAVLGVNDPGALAEADRVARRRIRERLDAAGVDVIDAQTTFVDDSARLGAGTVVGPQTVITGACRAGRGCRLGPGVRLRASTLADRVAIAGALVEGADLGAGSTVGPGGVLRGRGPAPEGDRAGPPRVAPTRAGRRSQDGFAHLPPAGWTRPAS